MSDATAGPSVPNLVPSGAYWRADLGHGRELLGYYRGDGQQWEHGGRVSMWLGDTRFAHRCDRGERGVIRCAPLLQPEHTVTSAEAGPTVSPSILCPDCGTHGFVRDGKWVQA